MSAAAAAIIKRQRDEEEEIMSSYHSQELTEYWEFKILRSATGAFKDPKVLRKALEEEQRAGWTLVEKFDNSRLRLKRPERARENDELLDFDAYRTVHGMTETKVAILVVLGFLCGAAVLLAIIAALAR